MYQATPNEQNITHEPPHPCNKQYGPKPDQEGWIEWEVFPKMTVKTYFRVHGSLKDGKGSDGKDPIVMLPGGPGVVHEYMLGLHDLGGRTTIFYDQIGSGRSTLLEDPRYMKLWDYPVWVEELKAVIDTLGLNKVGLYGHSSGGCLAMWFVIEHPEHVSSLLLGSAPGKGADWGIGSSARVCEMPWEVQEPIWRAVETGNYDAEDFKKANEIVSQEFLVDFATMPEECGYSFEQLEKESRVYAHVNGPSEFTTDAGTISSMNIPRRDTITCPTLVIYGSQDEAPQAFVNVYKSLTGVKHKKLEVIKGARHIGWTTHGEEYRGAMREFLKNLE